jgi:FMN-dependent NADH-azoreductase
MKVTVFNGSPRCRNSNTHVIAEAFLEGAASGGAETQNIFLFNKKINHCMGCFTCWFKTPGRCVHSDEMEDLLRSYRTSDIVCFATPVYTWNMSSCLKNFIDRLVPLKCPAVVSGNGHYDMQNSLGRMPDVIIISNAGFPGSGNFTTMREVMKTAAPILEIYRNCGMLLQNKSDMVREKVNKYLEFVKQAGFEIINGGNVSQKVIDGLNMELMPDAEYIKFISGEA